MRNLCLAVISLSLVVLLCEPLHAYQFLCGGYTITGTSGNCPVGSVDQDNQCGCSVNTAPVWPNSAINFKAEYQGGNGISANTFVQAVESAALQWSNVSCSSMLTAYGGTLNATSSARWGNHENITSEQGVFFVKSQSEWIEVTGSGAGSTLGVTVSPYNGWNCNNREIADTDILINGFISGGWDYASVQGTILHEMGHSIGLGHSCLTTNSNCNNSCTAVMAATGAAFSIPQQDDVNALCALYPGTSGGLGSYCDGNWDCTSGPCITFEGFTYCSESCGSGCATGYECATVNSQQVCVRQGLPGVGEPCISTCAGDAICLGGEDGGTCYQECNYAGNGSDCPSTQDCIELPLADGPSIGVCVDAGQPGGDCELTDGLCVDAHVCVYGATDGYRCRQECAPNSSNNCPTGERCFPLQGDNGQPSGGACFPGGSQTEGESCSSGMDCGEGLLCLDTFSGGMCMWECEPENPSCPLEGQICTTLTDGSGVCDPVGGATPGDNPDTGGGTDVPSGENSGQTSPDSSGGLNEPVICACDATTACDANCGCDPECICTCDATTACDDGCDCDPECASVFGCSVVAKSEAGGKGNPPGGLFVLGLALGGLVWRRRRR